MPIKEKHVIVLVDGAAQVWRVRGDGFKALAESMGATVVGVYTAEEEAQEALRRLPNVAPAAPACLPAVQGEELSSPGMICPIRARAPGD